MPEKSNKISIVLLGPGHGNNIDAFLDLLFLRQDFEVTLLALECRVDRAKFPLLKVEEYGHANGLLKKLKSYVKMIQLPRHDILMILGGSNLYEVIPALLLIRRRRTAFNTWGETIPRQIGEKGINAFLYRIVLKSVDAIFCNWYGVRNILLKNAPELEPKIYIQGWGLSTDFTEEKPVVSEFTKDYIKSVPDERVVFLNIRSIDFYNEIGKILDALLILKNSYPEYFKRVLYVFWHGNNVREVLLNQILNFINEHGLKDHLWCVKHPFIPTSDIRHIVDAADVVVNFVNRDQLSSSVLEAMYLKKQLIMSDIEAYRILNEECGTQLNLIPVTTEALVNEMKFTIDNVNKSSLQTELMDLRKSIVEKRFTRTNNAPAIAAKFNEILSK